MRLKSSMKLFIILALFSGMVTVGLFVSFGGLFAGDSVSYLYNARLINGLVENSLYSYRKPGYSWIMLLCNVVHGETFIGLLLVQAIMAMLMPLLIYKIIHRVYPPAAWVIAMGSVVGMIPYLYMKQILTEVPYMFFLLVSVLGAVSYLVAGKLSWFYITVLSLVVTLMIKASADLLFIGFIMIFFLMDRRRWIHYMLGMVICLLAISYDGPPIWHPNHQERHFGASVLGRSVFYQVYLGSEVYSKPGERIISTENGPATAGLFAFAREFIRKNPDYLRGSSWTCEPRYHQIIGQYLDNPQALIEAMQMHPNDAYYNYLAWVAPQEIEQEARDHWLWNVSVETIRRHPIMVLHILWKNIHHYFLGPPFSYRYVSDTDRCMVIMEHPYDFALVAETPYGYVERGDITPTMYSELTWIYHSDWLTAAGNWICRGWTWSFNYMRKTTFCLLGLVVPVLLIKGPKLLQAFVGLCIFVIGYSALTICISNPPLSRFIIQSYLIEYMIAFSGLWWMITEFNEHAHSNCSLH